MAFQVKPLHWLLGAGAALGAYYIFKPKPRFKGDVAKVGDEVHVSTAQLPMGSLPSFIPQGVGAISVLVRKVTPDFIDGPIVAYVLQETPSLIETRIPPVEPGVHVPKQYVGSVYRNGKAVA